MVDRNRIKSFNKVIKVAILSIIILLVTYILFNSLVDYYFWYDESGQFFLAKGLNHDSDPLAQPQGLLSALENNRYYNMDPGGFTILLHFWSKLGTQAWFLRILPLLFFLGTCLFLYKVCLSETQRKDISVLIGIIPFIYPLFYVSSVMLRAYSMELCGTSFGLYLLNHLEKHQSYSYVFLLSMTLSFFCFSRYSFIIVAFGFSLYVVWILYKEESFEVFIKKIIIYSVPLLLMILLIYKKMLLFQNPKIEALCYVKSLYEDKSLYFNRYSIMYYGLLFLYLIRTVKAKPIGNLHKITLIVTSVFFFLSSFNLYPWDYFRTISVTFLLVFTILIEVFKVIRNKGYMITISYALALIIIPIEMMREKYKDNEHNNEPIEELISLLDKTSFHNKKILIHKSFSPDVRYLYEYGILKSRKEKDGYPNNFLILKGGKHGFGDDRIAIRTIEWDNSNCDYVLSKRLDTGSKKYHLQNGTKYVYVKLNKDH